MENISFLYFLEQMMAHPILLVAVLLTLGVIFVNGWTDAPNAIATCVSTRCIEVNRAIFMAAICNFLGVIIMSLVNTRVAMTIKNMVNFDGDTQKAMIALCAAMAAIVIWAIGAWYFGIPTSESHALIAGLSGAAIALQGGLSGINGAEWLKVIYGLVLSTVLGFGVGYLICKVITVICRNVDRRKTEGFFTGGQIAGGAAMAFMHGAQDGQKFLGVLLLGLYLVNGMDTSEGAVLPIWMMVLCSLVMGVGTSIGGKKIIKSVGMDMVKLEKYQGFSADVAASFGIFLSTIFGIPVSTTHMKTTAIMGVGAVKRMSAINYSVVKDMILTWVLTFPGCGLIGYFMAKLFLHIM
ncbi:MAG: inorganic phosphate transporter [Lachnospiraceae bacterium]|nr:inorganic phosphate transporter [Lachnospiraceae bacterium]